MTIVILGAGEVGGATARQLANAAVASRLVLVDEAASVAKGKALDIAQAAPVDRYETQVLGSGDEGAVIGAHLLVVADRVGAGEWSDDTGLALIGRIARLNTTAPILCAGARQGSLIDRAVREGALPAGRIFGTAPEALRGAVISIVALEADSSPARIGLLVLGRPPHDVIVPWEAASLDGQRAVDVLTPPAIARIEARIPRLWPPGPFALGSAVTQVVRTIVDRRPRSHVLDVAPPGRAALGGSAVMLPARLGPGGIVRLEPTPLSVRDRVRLDTALAR